MLISQLVVVVCWRSSLDAAALMMHDDLARQTVAQQRAPPASLLLLPLPRIQRVSASLSRRSAIQEMSSVGGHPRDPNGDELPDFTAPEHAAAVQARTALGLSAHQAVLLLEGEWWRVHNAARQAWKEFRDAEEAHELPEEREGRARPGDAQQPEQARCVDARNSSATVYSTARECCSPSSLRHGVMQDPGLPPPELLANTSGATRLVYAHVVDSSCVPFFLKKHPTAATDRKSTRLNSSHSGESRMPSSA